jgi:hypothetical protein
MSKSSALEVLNQIPKVGMHSDLRTMESIDGRDYVVWWAYCPGVKQCIIPECGKTFFNSQKKCICPQSQHMSTATLRQMDCSVRMFFFIEVGRFVCERLKMRSCTHHCAVLFLFS